MVDRGDIVLMSISPSGSLQPSAPFLEVWLPHRLGI